MDVRDITAENVARAVGGTVERDGSILCRCPVHEASGTHNPSLVLTITDTRRILFHCRSQNCDAKHFQAIRDHLVKCGLPRSHVGGNRADKEDRYTYQHPDGTYAWTRRDDDWMMLVKWTLYKLCWRLLASNYSAAMVG
jgi:hypothetical protein